MAFLQRLSLVQNFKTFGVRKMWSITILAMADVFAMLLPFYLKNFFPEIFRQFGISEAEFNFVLSLYGYVLLPAYLFGGYLADKFSLRWLTVIGLGLIGIFGFWYGTVPIMGTTATSVQVQLGIIFVVWGLATGFVFWSALWKLLSQQATDKQQGAVNGALGSINGLFGLLIVGFAYGAYALFNLGGTELQKWAFPVMAYIFSAGALIVCLLTLMFVKEKPNKKEFTFSWDHLKVIIGNVRVWLVAILILGVYMFQTGLSIFVNYLESSLKIATGIVFALGIIRTYVSRFAFSSGAGKVADRWGKYILFITIGLIINAALMVVAIVAPGFGNDINALQTNAPLRILIQVAVSAVFILMGIVCWALVTNRWAVINELKIPEKNYGLMVAFISLIAFSPDAWLWHISSVIYSKYEYQNGINALGKPNMVTGQNGYQIMLAIILGVALISVIAGCILLILKRVDHVRINATQKNKLNALSKKIA